MFRGICAIALATMISACSGPKIVVNFAPQMEKEISSVVVIADSDVFAERLTRALNLRGMRTLPPDAVMDFIKRFRATGTESPLAALKAAGIDAYVQAWINGSFHKPENIVLQVKNNDGKLVRELTWVNAWRGDEGTLADYHSKRDALEAVDQIADALIEALRPTKSSDVTAMAPGPAKTGRDPRSLGRRVPGFSGTGNSRDLAVVAAGHAPGLRFPDPVLTQERQTPKPCHQMAAARTSFP